jgi:hypothetical protein
MKHSALYSIVAGLALGATLLPGTALAEKKTTFDATEIDDMPQDFPWFPGTDGDWYVFDGRETFEMVSDEPRVTGSGSYSIYAIMDANTTTVWGELHIVNTDRDGFWDGYWTGNEDGFSATCVGSGKYKGLVSRWTAPPSLIPGIYNWEGYIVENGPGYVPFKNSGWREENVERISETLPFAKATSFGTGAGQGSHIGNFTDVKEVGLMMFTSPTTGISRGMGAVEAANGDLLTWVSFGAMSDNGEFAFKVFFAGRTGRFEHAVGSWEGELNYTTQAKYTYRDTGTGTIRY